MASRYPKRTKYTINHGGSTWLKWDLHVHTPGTKLSDAYSVNDGGDVWDRFIEKLDASDVSVFGITDYFSIDNYEMLCGKYSGKGHKGKRFFPNIEFRLDVSVNKKAEEVNVHVIFDDNVDAKEIRRFLDQLETNLTENGRNIPCSKLSSKDQFEKAAINIDKLEECLKNIFDKRHYIIGVASNNQGLRPDTNSPRKMNVTDYIERKCEFIFGGYQNRDYYLDTNRYENRETAQRKPVVSGCDAHSFEDLDEKLGKGPFCTWIKSMPTFIGLRQMLFEPEDRVAIQISEPDYKEKQKIIKSICIEDTADHIHLFGNQKIILNKNLNTIIGGKSSGKSLLLYSLAKSIDVDQLNKIHEKFKDFERYNIEDTKFIVEWADEIVNTTDADDYFDVENIGLNRKITYIPQLYINHLAEKNGREELNDLINEILLNNYEYKVFRVDVENQITKENNRITIALNTLIKLWHEWFSVSNEIKNYGTPEAYDKEIDELTKQYNALNISSSFSEDEITDYRKLKSDLVECNDKLTRLNTDKYYLRQLQGEIEQNIYHLLGDKENNALGALYKYKAHLLGSHINISRITEIIKDGYYQIIKMIEQEFPVSAIESSIVSVSTEKIRVEQSLKKHEEKISSKSELSVVIEKIDKLKQNKIYISELSNKFEMIRTEYQNIKANISQMLLTRNELYKSIEKYTNENMNNFGLGITLSCKLLYNLNNCKLFDYLNRQYNINHNLRSLFDEKDKLVNYNFLPDIFLSLVKIENGDMVFKDKSTQSLKTKNDLETIYKALVEDNLSIVYDVTYKGDNLLKMSPGKKGTVLLILFLELSSSENPILIDQPEDNLDNRTIYDLLCQMVKTKKKKRQIIIVTHNANLVVNTDAENVIVANQQGQDIHAAVSDSGTRFEYVNGPIELSFRDEEHSGIMTKIGIKQHICDILEGGREAFKLRELKYGEE